MTHIEEARVIAFAAAGQVHNNEDAKCVETLVEKLVYAALAAAEERGRQQERERCAIETGGVLVEMPSHPPNLMARVLAYLEGSDPKATSGGERNSDLRDGVRKVLEASK